MSDTGGSRERPLTRPLALAELAMAKDKIANALSIFVAGPYIERGWSPADNPPRSPAALLRIRVISHIEGTSRHSVVLGEHRGVLDIGDTQLRSQSSPTLVELKLVKTQCDAVIVIPASPGSFSELGAWSLFDDVCRKMLILADSRFKDSGGYINLGVFKTAMNNGAVFDWVDYSDDDLIINAVDRHIERIDDKMTAHRIIHG